MYKIEDKIKLSDDVYKIVVQTPRIAKKRKAGQFVILRAKEHSERIPLTICDSDDTEGTITLIVQSIGFSTKEINSIEKGDYFFDVAGPLGKPTRIEKIGTVLIIGGGIGAAVSYPIAKAMKKAGNYIISIIGARNKDLIILEEETRLISDELIITTDDGSYGRKGLVIDPLKDKLNKNKIDIVFAIGPLIMMKSVSDITKEHGVKTYVSLNPIMIDGTGMCGGCRVTVGDVQKFVCVDGPEFDAHQVNFNELQMRLGAYRDLERRALEKHKCRLDN